MSALISRLAQSFFEDHALLPHTYTDDPLATMLGDQHSINHYVSVLILVWRVLGFKLAFKKGQLGNAVCWVGYDIATDADAHTIRVSIKKEFMEELTAMTQDFLKRNVVGRRDLKSYTGKVSHVANMIWVIKPFMEQLWAACESSGGSKQGCVWRRQIDDALSWIKAFLDNQHGPHTPGVEVTSVSRGGY